MDLILYYLFFAPNTGCVILRDVFTISFILYLLKIINLNLLKKICSIMFVPLLIGLFASFLSSIFFELTGKGYYKYKKMFDDHEEILDKKRNINKNSFYKMKNIDIIRYLYKVIIFYLVIKYIKPEFNLINIFVPMISIFIYFNLISVEESHFGKKVDINLNYLLTFIFGSVLLLFYILYKNYNKINIIHIAILFITYCIFIMYM